MKFYSYVIPRDFGFAPNPYFEYCTLATCKPRIRKGAQIGDWIGAFGSARMTISKKLVVLMQVEEILTFDEYWEDDRWVQEPSHHSNTDNSINYLNLNRDTKVDRVLVATEFYYFGSNAISMPEEFEFLIGKGRNHRICNDETMIQKFIDYVRHEYRIGIHGIPYSRENGKFIHYGGK